MMVHNVKTMSFLNNEHDNKGFSLVELVVVMAIMGFLGLAVAGFIGTSSNQYKYASKEVDLQYEAQIAMNQIGDLLIDAQKGVKYENGAVSPVSVETSGENSVQVQSVLTGDAAIDNAAIAARGVVTKTDDTDSQEVKTQTGTSESKLIIYNSDCVYNIIFKPSESKLYLRKDTVDASTGNTVEGQESLMADHVVGFTPDLSDAEKKNSVQIAIDFKDGEKTYTSTQNFTMRNKVPVGKDVEYVEEPEPEEPTGIRIYYKGKDVTNGTVYYEMSDRPNSNKLKFTDKILGGYDSKNVVWGHSGTNNGGNFNANGDVYNVELMTNETTNQFVITVESNENHDLKAKVTVNVGHPLMIIECTNDYLFSYGSTKDMSINNSELEKPPLNNKYSAKDFWWHIEAYDVSSTGTEELLDSVICKMNNNGSDVLFQEGSGEPDGLFKYSIGEVVGEMANKNKLNYHLENGNAGLRISAGNELLTNKRVRVVIWLSVDDDPSFRSNTVDFKTYRDE